MNNVANSPQLLSSPYKTSGACGELRDNQR